jgi:hypothetical protein
MVQVQLAARAIRLVNNRARTFGQAVLHTQEPCQRSLGQGNVSFTDTRLRKEQVADGSPG